MSKTRSEAERLLNTIVSSRVRLSTLQGEPASTLEPSLADEDSEPLDAAPTDHPDIAPQDDINAASDRFADLPVEDDMTDFEDPPLILGIQPDAPPPGTPASEEDEFRFFEDRPSNTADPVAQPAIEPETSAPAAARPEIVEDEGAGVAQKDPFSFIDLIPPDPDAGTAEDETRPAKPSLSPPPIRTKPLMPLPTAEAAGAPAAPVEQPEASTSSWDRPLSTKGMSKPREIVPRILDPDRAQLEVDVYVNEEEEFEPGSDFSDSEPPQLTDATAPSPTPHTAPTTQLQQESVFDLVTDGMNALSRGDISTALNLLSDALDWEPDNIEARLYRGRCRRDRGDIAGAMSDFLKAESTAPHSCEPHVELGDLFFAKKEYGRAIMHYTEALSIHPGHAMALCRRGISYHHRRQPVQALDDLDGAKKLNPDIPNINRYISMVTSRRRIPSRR